MLIIRLVCYFGLFVGAVGAAIDPNNTYWQLAFSIFAAASFVSLLLGSNNTPAKGDYDKNYKNYLILILIIIAGAVLRLLWLSEIPYGRWFDEAENVIVTQRILNVPGYWPIFIADKTQMPALLFYFYTPFVHLFPGDVYSVRLASALIGVLSIFVTYLLAKEVFNEKVALLAAFFLAISRWHITFSRFGMAQISTTVFFPIVLLLFIKALENRRYKSAAICGVALGIALQSYYATVVLVPLIAIAFVYRWIFSRSGERPPVLQLPIIFLTAFIVYSPLFYFAYYNWEEFSKRFSAVSDVKISYLFDLVSGVFAGQLNENAEKLWFSMAKHFVMFNFYGDANGRHNLPGAPMLDPAMGALFVIGFFAALRHMFSYKKLILLLWLGSVLAEGIFSLGFEAPQAGRTTAIVPVVAMLCAWGAWIAFRLRAVPLLFVGLFALGWNLYLGLLQATDRSAWAAYSTVETKIGRLLQELPDDQPLYVAEVFHDSPTERLLSPNKSSHPYQKVSDTIAPASAAGAVVVFGESQASFIDDVRKIYPGAAIEDFNSPESPLHQARWFLKILRARKEDIARIRDTTMNCVDNPEIVEPMPATAIDWAGFAARHNCRAVWSASVLNESYGEKRLALAGGQRIDILLNEQPFLLDVSSDAKTLMLPEGIHRIDLRAKGEQKGVSSVRVLASDTFTQAKSPVELANKSLASGGLTGEYYADSKMEGKPAFLRLDSSLKIYFHILPLGLPFSVRWHGKLVVPQDGIYVIGSQARDQSLVYVDDKLIVDQRTPGIGVFQSIELTKGMHPIEVHYLAEKGYSGITLSWRTPDSTELVPIPAANLRP